MVDPYIDAIDCIQTNGTNPCDDSDTGKWPHNATIYRRDSQTNETAAVVKLRIEGKGDPGGNGSAQQTVIVMDDTGSMAWNDPNNLRFTASKAYVDKMKVPDEVGFVIYADTLPNGQLSELRSPLTTNYPSAKNGMYGNSNGGTPMINGFQTANNEIIPKKKSGMVWSIIHVTDGCWNTGGDPQPEVNRMVNENIPMFNIGLYPDPNSSDKQLCEPDLVKWSQQTGGSYYWAQSASDISKLMDTIYRDVSHSSTNDIAGSVPKSGTPLITYTLTNDIEVVPGSFNGSENYTPTNPAQIVPGNRGLRLEWAKPIPVLMIKRNWEVTFKVRSYLADKSVKVNDFAGSYVSYDKFNGSAGGHDPFEQLYLEVMPPPTSQFPYVMSTDPAEGSSGIKLNAKILLTWSKEMNHSATESAFLPVPDIQCTWSWAGTVQTCLPSSPLYVNISYQVAISTKAKDSYGSSMLAPFTLNFTTGSESYKSPVVISTSPKDGSVLVPISSRIQVTFSESMHHGATESAISIQPAIAGNSIWDALDKTIILKPDVYLLKNTEYKVVISTTAMSQAGINMQAPFLFSFTTSDDVNPRPPMVLSTEPKNGANDVSRDTNIMVTFSKPMERTSTTSSITMNPDVSYDLSWSYGDTRFTLTPSNLLKEGTLYLIIININAKSTDGISLDSPFVFSFTTSVEPERTPPTVIATYPQGNETDIDPSAQIKITFSEPMNRSSAESAISILPGSILSYKWSNFDSVLTLNASLEKGTLYTVIIYDDTKDLAGNKMEKPYTFSFKTTDPNEPRTIDTLGISSILLLALVIVLVTLFLLFKRTNRKKRPKRRAH
jgi:hypothetical protein